MKDKNSYYEERYRLIEADVQFSSIPRPDYSKMTNEQIAKRIEMIDQTLNGYSLQKRITNKFKSEALEKSKAFWHFWCFL
ncbi:hypothetical protein E4O93_05870 [Diaphorobacter sp. DS2]|nr:hypothetical protein E4O93_05870 [Diaphorobacter sp. DS2]